MTNTLKKSAIISATMLAAVGTQVIAHADDAVTTTPTTPETSTSTPSTGAVTETVTAQDVTSAETTLNVAETNVNIAENKLTDAQYNDNLAKAGVVDAQAALDQATTNVAASTPENIATAENTIANTKTEITNTQAELAADTKAAEVAQSEQAKQDLIVDKVAVATTDAAKQVSIAQESVTNAETALTTNNSAKLESDKAAAEKQVSIKSTDVVKATENLKEATISDAQLAADQKAALDVKTTAQTNMQNALTTKTADQKLADAANATVAINQQAVDALVAKVGVKQTITLTAEYIAALKKSADYLAPQADRDAANATLKRLNQQHLDMNNFVSNPKDNTAAVDPQNLTDAQQQELTFFAVDLINQLRRQLGTTELKVTPTALKLADLTTDNYKTDNFDSMYGGHDVNAMNKAAKAVGLATSTVNSFENKTAFPYTNSEVAYFSQVLNWDLKTPMSYSPASQTYNLTMNDLKRVVYRSIELLMFNGAEWVHAKSITAAPSLYEASSVNTKQYGAIDFASYDGIMSVHVLTYSDAQIENNSLVDNTKLVDPNANIQASIAAAQAKLDTSKQVATNTQAKATISNKDYVAKKAVYDAAVTNYNNLLAQPNKLNEVQKALTTAQNELAQAQTQLKNINDAIAVNNKSTAEKQALVDKAKAELAKKQDALIAAQNLLASEQAKLKTADLKLEVAENTVTATSVKLYELNKQLKLQEDYLQALIDAKENLNKAQAVYGRALTRKNVTTDELQAAKDELLKYKGIYEEANANYQRIKSLYDLLHPHVDAPVEKPADPKDLTETESAQPAKSEKLNNASPGVFSVTFTDYSKEANKIKAQTLAKETSVKDELKTNKENLPSTNENNSAAAALLGATLVAGTVALTGRKKKRNS